MEVWRGHVACPRSLGRPGLRPVLLVQSSFFLWPPRPLLLPLPFLMGGLSLSGVGGVEGRAGAKPRAHVLEPFLASYVPELELHLDA